MEILEQIFKRQKTFQKNFYDVDNLTEDQKIKLTKEFILCMHRELGEILNIIPWKAHRANNKQYNVDELHEEIIDTFKFMLNLCLIWGIDTDKFNNLFHNKSKIVEQRYSEEKVQVKQQKLL